MSSKHFADGGCNRSCVIDSNAILLSMNLQEDVFNSIAFCIMLPISKMDLRNSDSDESVIIADNSVKKFQNVSINSIYNQLNLYFSNLSSFTLMALVHYEVYVVIVEVDIFY